MADDADADEVPEGAAVFPLIPAELGVHPLLLAVLHAYVFLDGSDDGGGQPGRAPTRRWSTSSRTSSGSTARSCGACSEDMDTLVGYAKREKWPQAAGPVPARLPGQRIVRRA